MSRRRGALASIVAAAVLLAPGAAPAATASQPAWLLCNKFSGPSGDNVAYRTARPKGCAIWRAGWAHYQALTFIKAHWTGWGKRAAHARVTLTGNGGYRTPGRITVYRLRPDCAGNGRVYTRVKLLAGGSVVKAQVFRPDTCTSS
jgi:hypothetical protein